MNKHILGIDLGTSSVKLLLRHADGQVQKSKASYSSRTPDGWHTALREAAACLDLTHVAAIGLSSQVGTYIVNDTEVINWDDPIGRKELHYLKQTYSSETFIRELDMPHPDIISYPLPRLLYISKHFSKIHSICQPKDLICQWLTGRRITDKYSLRGLVHTRKGTYSHYFLEELHMEEAVLPPLAEPDAICGITTPDCKVRLGIPEGLPVFTGCNDFFAGLIGMGLQNSGEIFDITGTSEHIGFLCENLAFNTSLVSGVYFDQHIQYGVTASSGPSLHLAMREFTDPASAAEFSRCLPDIDTCLKRNPPIFTPYVNGERAPIFDSNARGVFFGIASHCTKEDLAYAVLEGVAFSLYHIYEHMTADTTAKPTADYIKVSGGAAHNPVLNRIKAELFGKELQILAEQDASALGAVMLAANGLGMSTEESLYQTVTDRIVPDGSFREKLLARYHIYKNLYPKLKKEFHKFAEIGKESRS